MKKKPSIAGTRDAPGRHPSDGARARRIMLFAALCLLATESTAPMLVGLESERLAREAENLATSAFDELAFEAHGELLPGLSNPLAMTWLSGPSAPDVTGAVEYTLVPTQLAAVDATASPLRRSRSGASDDDVVDVSFGPVNVGSMVAMSSPATVTGTADPSADEAPTLAGNMMAAVYPPMLLAATPRSGLPTGELDMNGRKSIPSLSLERRAALGNADRTDREWSQQASRDAAGLPLVNGLGDYSGLATHTPGSPMGPHAPGVLHGLKDFGVGASWNAPPAHHPGLASHHTPGRATRPSRSTAFEALDDSAAALNALTVQNAVLAAMMTSGLPESPQITQQLAPFQSAAAAVPEPTTLALLALGVIALGFSLRRR